MARLSWGRSSDLDQAVSGAKLVRRVRAFSFWFSVSAASELIPGLGKTIGAIDRCGALRAASCGRPAGSLWTLADPPAT